MLSWGGVFLLRGRRRFFFAPGGFFQTPGRPPEFCLPPTVRKGVFIFRNGPVFRIVRPLRPQTPKNFPFFWLFLPGGDKLSLFPSKTQNSPLKIRHSPFYASLRPLYARACARIALLLYNIYYSCINKKNKKRRTLSPPLLSLCLKRLFSSRIQLLHPRHRSAALAGQRYFHLPRSLNSESRS